MSKKPAPQTDDNPTLQMDEVKARADELGCYMQLFIAYNPETEMLMVASNAPDARNSQETALLLALAADTTAERLERLLKAAGASVEVEGDDPPRTVN